MVERGSEQLTSPLYCGVSPKKAGWRRYLEPAPPTLRRAFSRQLNIWIHSLGEENCASFILSSIGRPDHPHSTDTHRLLANSGAVYACANNYSVNQLSDIFVYCLLSEMQVGEEEDFTL